MSTSPANFPASSLLREVAEALDITPTQRQQAIASYTALGRFLCQEGSSLALYQPSVYPQGSFEIGTVTKPIHRDEDFDLDVVCCLDTTTSSHTQAEVKAMLGDRLKEDATYRRMLGREKRRCWELNYAEAAKFHMDVLPAIPDDENYLIAHGINPEYCEAPICLTDNKDEKHYHRLNAAWRRSNPKGYAQWFRHQMSLQLFEARQILAKERRMSVDQVSVYEVRTPLQRAIQLMKRHRSMLYGQDPDRPISVIITTLAARAYADSPSNDLFTTLISLLDRMGDYIEVREVSGRKVDWIESPVTPFENYADKWAESPRKRSVFYEWLTRARSDFSTAFEQSGLTNIGSNLKQCLGGRVVERALSNYGQRLAEARSEGALYVTPVTGTLNTDAKGLPVKNHLFYGSGL